jgi:uncharacterized protein (DUF433 family)
MIAKRKQKPASAVVSLRVTTDQTVRLKRKARQLGRTPSETGAMLLEEGLRRADFAFIDFRDSAVGRQAYVLGSRVAVWQVAALVRAFEGDADKAADHLAWPTLKIRAAMSYADAFRDEIDSALSDAKAPGLAELRRTLPQLEEFRGPGSGVDQP